MSNIRVISNNNQVRIQFPNEGSIVASTDGELVAANGTGGDDSVKITRVEDSFVVLDVSDFTRIKDSSNAQIGTTRDLTVSNLNTNFLNSGTSITNLGDVTEDTSIDKAAGKKLYLVMDSGRFKVTNIPDADLTDATLNVSQLPNDNIRIRLNRTFQDSPLEADDVTLNQGTGITYGFNGTTVTINGFSGDYDDLTNKPSLATVATSGDYDDLTNLPTIPTDTNIGNTDMTLSGARAVNMNGNDLDFKDGSTSKLLYDDSEDEWVFNVPVVFKQPSAIGEIRLQENPQGGDAAVVLKGPNTNIASDVTFNLPSADGSNGEVLKTNGSGVLSFSSALDGSPTLQAASTADLNGEDFTINVNGGNFFVKESASTRLQVDQTDVVIQGLTFPSSDGSANQVLKTNGSGVLSFVDQTADTNTSLADTDQTLTGGRTINVNQNDLFIKDGSNIKLQFDSSEDEFLFTSPVRFDGGNAGGFIKLRETVMGGTDGVILRAPSGAMSGDVEFRLPNADGTSGSFIKTDGSGNLSFGFAHLSHDSSPQLGGDLDVNGNKIVSASDGDIVIDPNGTGAIILKSDDVRLEGTDTSVEVGTVKLYESDLLGDNFVALKAPLSITSDVTFTLPAADGTDGQVLKTNGSGTLSFGGALTGVNDTITGVTQIKDAGSTRGTVSFYDDAGDNFTALRAADTLSADTVFHLPDADGSAGQFIKTDGSGNLSFGDAGGGTTLTQVYSQSFLDNIGTTKHYLPFKDINEQTTIYQEEAAMFMPFDGKVRSVSIRIPAITGTSGNMTIGVHTINTGNSGMFNSGLWTTEETETVAVANTDDHRSIHFVFDDAQHFEAGDLLAISIQCSTSLFGGSKYVYVSTIIDYDTSSTMPSTSQVLSSNP